jgi:hypothetical protein
MLVQHFLYHMNENNIRWLLLQDSTAEVEISAKY